VSFYDFVMSRRDKFDHRGVCAALGALVVLVIASPVLAHDLARSDSRLEVQGATVRCQLIVDLLEFPGVDQDGNGTISYTELDRSIADIFTRIKANLILRGPDEPSAIVMTRHELVDEHTARIDLAYTFPSNVSRLDVTSTFDRLARRPDHQHYVTIKMGGAEQRAVLDPSRRTVTFEDQWWTRTSIWLTVAALALLGGRVGWFLRGRRRSG
jgi:LPXTG-motif cell wall-anchored protein